LVDKCYIIRDAIVWSYLFFAFIVNSINTNSDQSYVACTFIAPIVISYTAIRVKRIYMDSKLMSLKCKNDVQAKIILYTML
jgi:hypothetical protein